MFFDVKDSSCGWHSVQSQGVGTNSGFTAKGIRPKETSEALKPKDWRAGIKYKRNKQTKSIGLLQGWMWNMKIKGCSQSMPIFPARSVDRNSTEQDRKEKRQRPRRKGGLHICPGCARGAGRTPPGEVQQVVEKMGLMEYRHIVQEQHTFCGHH